MVLASQMVARGGSRADEEAARVLDEANGYFERANEAALTDPAEAGKLYKEAALRFEYLSGEGGIRNGYVLGNLANTYFLGGDLGRAILNYRRALELNPGNGQLRASLAHAREQRVDVFEVAERPAWVEWLFFWHFKLKSEGRATLIVVAYVGIWVLALWRLFSGKPRESVFRQWLAGCALVCVLIGFSMMAHLLGKGGREAAVLLSDEVEARKGNGFIYERAFQSALHAGTEIEVLEMRGDWIKGLFGNGEAAWVPREVVAFVTEAGSRG